jgi:hypothetical protein
LIPFSHVLKEHTNIPLFRGIVNPALNTAEKREFGGLERGFRPFPPLTPPFLKAGGEEGGAIAHLMVI